MFLPTYATVTSNLTLGSYRYGTGTVTVQINAHFDVNLQSYPLLVYRYRTLDMLLPGDVSVLVQLALFATIDGSCPIRLRHIQRKII